MCFLMHFLQTLLGVSKTPLALSLRDETNTLYGARAEELEALLRALCAASASRRSAFQRAFLSLGDTTHHPRAGRREKGGAEEAEDASGNRRRRREARKRWEGFLYGQLREAVLVRHPGSEPGAPTGQQLSLPYHLTDALLTASHRAKADPEAQKRYNALVVLWVAALGGQLAEAFAKTVGPSTASTAHPPPEQPPHDRPRPAGEDSGALVPTIPDESVCLSACGASSSPTIDTTQAFGSHVALAPHPRTPPSHQDPFVSAAAAAEGEGEAPIVADSGAPERFQRAFFGGWVAAVYPLRTLHGAAGTGGQEGAEATAAAEQEEEERRRGVEGAGRVLRVEIERTPGIWATLPDSVAGGLLHAMSRRQLADVFAAADPQSWPVTQLDEANERRLFIDQLVDPDTFNRLALATVPAVRSPGPSSSSRSRAEAEELRREGEQQESAGLPESPDSLPASPPSSPSPTPTRVEASSQTTPQAEAEAEAEADAQAPFDQPKAKAKACEDRFGVALPQPVTGYDVLYSLAGLGPGLNGVVCKPVRVCRPPRGQVEGEYKVQI